LLGVRAPQSRILRHRLLLQGPHSRGQLLRLSARYRDRLFTDEQFAARHPALESSVRQAHSPAVPGEAHSPRTSGSGLPAEAGVRGGRGLTIRSLATPSTIVAPWSSYVTSCCNRHSASRRLTAGARSFVVQCGCRHRWLVGRPSRSHPPRSQFARAGSPFGGMTGRDGITGTRGATAPSMGASSVCRTCTSTRSGLVTRA
jgi:hypothetical protein